MSSNPPIPPAFAGDPTIVVGLGRFGLALLEQLGASWARARAARPEAALGNLRLVYVEGDDDTSPSWRANEAEARLLADAIGDGDAPNQALDFLFLRCLGFIRFHRGMYQVACARDFGPTDKEDGTSWRVRTFDWIDLNEEPERALSALRLQVTRNPDLDNFITPFLERVRAGHSPMLIANALVRVSHYCDGKDPSPWPLGSEEDDPAEELYQKQPDVWWSRVESAGSRISAEPIEAFLRDERDSIVRSHDAAATIARFQKRRVTQPEVKSTIFDRVPEGDGDLAFDLRSILEIPWETVGWTTHEVREDKGLYEVAELPFWAHGLFDAPCDEEERQKAFDEKLPKKLERIGQLCRRGLLSLFVELRNRERPAHAMSSGVDNEDADDRLALQQSTDMIAEILWSKADKRPDTAWSRKPPPVESFDLGSIPSARLRELMAPTHSRASEALALFDERAVGLGGIGSPGASDGASVFFETRLHNSPNEAYDRTIQDLRRQLRGVATRLLESRGRAERGGGSTEIPPRLTVHVVGDLGEPFVRKVMLDVLSNTHAEMLRAFSAIFKNYRSGFDRNLAIVPTFWLPNPAMAAPTHSAQSEEVLSNVRYEENVVLDKLLGLRRWLFRTPPHERFVPLVYLCSRLNDRSVLSLGESVRQTHDFLSFCMRSQTSKDDWLRTLAVGQEGRDLFATFGCVELEFPVERIREYLACRFARMALGEVLHGRLGGGAMRTAETIDESEAEDAALDDCAESACEALQARCAELAKRIAANLSKGDAELDPDEVLSTFSDARRDETGRFIQEEWRPLVAQGGAMDERMDRLRRLARSTGDQAVERVRQRSDQIMDAVRGGAVLTVPIEQLEQRASEERERLQHRNADCALAQRAAQAEALPDPRTTLASGFSAVRDAASAVPRRAPIYLGLALLLPFGFVSLGGLGHALSVMLGLPSEPGVAEWCLRTLFPYVGALCVVGLAGWLLRRLRLRALSELSETIDRLNVAVYQMIAGPEDSIASFLRSRAVLMAELMKQRVAALRSERARVDESLARELRRGAETADRDLRAYAESLGVRTQPPVPISESHSDDLRGLLGADGGERPSLVTQQGVDAFYDEAVGPTAARYSAVAEVTEPATAHLDWRDGGWFSERAALLAPGQERFAGLLSEESWEIDHFAADAVERLERYSRSYAAAVGFPASLDGAEGLDDDGVLVFARGDLVGPSRLVKRLNGSRNSSARTRAAKVRPHAAYLLTLAQGIAPRLLGINRRRLGYHDGGKSGRAKGEKALNLLSGLDDAVNAIWNSIKTTSKESTPPSTTDTGGGSK